MYENVLAGKNALLQTKVNPNYKNGDITGLIAIFHSTKWNQIDWFIIFTSSWLRSINLQTLTVIDELHKEGKFKRFGSNYHI